MIEIDDAFVYFLRYKLMNKTVAIVGELNKLRTEATLAYKVKHTLGAKSVEVFTAQNLFTIEDGNNFDVIIGVRPCAGTEVILDSAIKYKKTAYVVLCQCGGYKEALLKYLPKCTKCEFIAQNNSIWSWPVLIIT